MYGCLLGGQKYKNFIFKLGSYRVVKWNWNQVWLYCSVYGAVLNCSAVLNLGSTFSENWIFYSKFKCVWINFILNLQTKSFSCYLYNLIFALIYRHFIELSWDFTAWLEMHQINKLYKNNFKKVMRKIQYIEIFSQIQVNIQDFAI